MPKALWKLDREDGEDPVVMTPEYITLSQREVWSHLLCESCELLFSQRGEDPVISLPINTRFSAGMPLSIWQWPSSSMWIARCC